MKYRIFLNQKQTQLNIQLKIFFHSNDTIEAYDTLNENFSTIRAAKERPPKPITTPVPKTPFAKTRVEKTYDFIENKKDPSSVGNMQLTNAKSTYRDLKSHFHFKLMVQMFLLNLFKVDQFKLLKIKMFLNIAKTLF